jgi:hypothetical protein
VSRRRRFARWFERVVLGAVMSVIAFVIERRVLKAIRTKGETTAGSERKGEVTQGTHGPQVST